jgi:hypothetical protein
MIIPCIEIRVIVLVEQDRLTSIGTARPATVNQSPDIVRTWMVVPMQQNEIGNIHHCLRGHAAKAHADKKTPAGLATWPRERSWTRWMSSCTRRVKDVLMVVQVWQAEVGNVCLIVDFHQYVAIAVVEKPVGRSVAGANDSILIGQSLILAPIEKSEDRSHAEFVGSIEDQPQTRRAVRPQIPGSIES